MSGLGSSTIKVMLLAVVLGSLLCLSEANTNPLVAQGSLQFEEVADRAGLHYRDETAGFAWGDFDGDGFLDLFLGHHPVLTEIMQDRDSALMRNNGNGTFTNVIYGSGILLQEDRHDAAWVDVDHDGDLDLWVSIGGRGGQGEGPSQLYRNDGQGRFSDIAAQVGLDYPRGRGRGTAWLDYDLDGDLDLYFTGAESDVAPNAFFRNNGNGTFTNIIDHLGLEPFLGAMSNVAVADYDGDGDQDVLVTGYSTRLYRNSGGGGFTDVSVEAGVRVTASSGASWGDYDGDGLLDLYVARGGRVPHRDFQQWDSGEVRFVLRLEESDEEDGFDIYTLPSTDLSFELQNRIGGGILRDPRYVHLGSDGHHPPAGVFTMSGSQVSGPPSYTPGVDQGYFIWQSSPGVWHLRCSAVTWEAPEACQGIVTAAGQIQGVTEVGFEPLTIEPIPDVLYRNQGDGTFEDVTLEAGLGDERICLSPTWGDYDNDGLLDLYVQVAGPMEADGPNLLYHNNGDGTFTDVASAAGVTGTTEGHGWGSLWADYDNDGFLDLLTNQESWWWPLAKGRYELYHNLGNSNHWLKVDLRGVQSNPGAYGAKVWLTAGGRTQFREVGDHSHYFQHYTGPLHFGLGDATSVSELKVVWPSGLTQTFKALSVDQRITVAEGSGPVAWPTSTPGPTSGPTSYPTPSGSGTPTSYPNATPTAVATQQPGAPKLPWETWVPALFVSAR